jgi:hypothetical protein
MNYLKIVSKGWTGYTGGLGTVTFKNGVSTEPVPRRIADRLAAVTQMIEVDAEGNEITAAGIAHRLVTETPGRAPVKGPLARQTEAERAEEERLDMLRKEKAPASKFYTAGELEVVASEKGLKGLREIADPWGVKDRSIPGLIAAILKAQAAFLEKRNQRLQQLTDKAAAAAAEAAEKEKAEAKAKADAQAAADAEASVLAPIEGLAGVYKAGDKLVPGAVILEYAWQISNRTLTGFNALKIEDKAALVEKAKQALAERLGAELVPVSANPEPAAAETLLGSSVLASTYEIAGKTVQLGEIVAGAFSKFEGSVDEWNELANEAREDLVRLELDRLLAAE